MLNNIYSFKINPKYNNEINIPSDSKWLLLATNPMKQEQIHLAETERRKGKGIPSNKVAHILKIT